MIICCRRLPKMAPLGHIISNSACKIYMNCIYFILYASMFYCIMLIIIIQILYVRIVYLNSKVMKYIFFSNFRYLNQIKINQLHAVSRTQHDRQRAPSVKTVRSPLYAEF